MKDICIVTTASIPWLTGTAILPLARASALVQRGFSVRLYVPWVESKNAQSAIFPPGVTFSQPEEQRAYVKKWLEDKHLDAGAELAFYPAKYIAVFRSIYPSVNLAKFLPETDLLILEEPEHLFFFQPWNLSKLKAAKICGIVLTNYSYYCEDLFGKLSFALTPLYDAYDLFLKRKLPLVIRLSSALKGPENGVVSNVDGVLPKFFAPVSEKPEKPSTPFYYIGKFEWYKGFGELTELWTALPPEISKYPIDCFGGGSQMKEIIDTCKENGLQINHQPPTLSPEVKLAPYKTFINASVSEGLCTTSMEALAMGKWLVIPEHPSNEFFYGFSNCLVYRDRESFVEVIQKTFEEMPTPLSGQEAEKLTWNAATGRLLSILEKYGPELI